MKVLIDDKQRLYLESDSYQFLIKRYTGKEDNKGNEISTTVSSHDSLEQVIKKIYKLKIKESTATNLKELLEDHKRIHKEIENLFKVEGIN